MLERRDQPSLSRFILGTAAGILLTICVALSVASGAVVSIPLKVILFFPDQLGLVWRVTPENTLTFARSGLYRLPEFPAGPYLIYFDAGVPTADIELISEGNGAPVPLVPIPGVLTVDQRNLGPGQLDVPSYRFRVVKQDTYLLRVDFWGVGGFRITPDISTHNDWILIGSTIIQIALLGLVIWWVYRRRNHDRLAAEKIIKAASRDKFEDWFEKYQDEEEK